MSEQTINFEVDSGLLHAFSHAAARNSCNDRELLRAFMADYVQQDTRKQQYDAWFRAKVQKGLTELEDGKGFTHDEAAAQMAVFKTGLSKASEDNAL